MQYLKDVGYVIKRKNFSEADKYITILTQYNGKIDVLAKGVRKLSSKRSPQLELLNKISFQAVSKGQTSRFVLADVSLIENHTSLKNTLEQFKVLFTICELISVLCPAGQRQEDVFRLLDNSLTEMKNGTAIMQKFQVKLLGLLGYWDVDMAFVDADDINSFTEKIMERKLKSSEYFRT